MNTLFAQEKLIVSEDKENFSFATMPFVSYDKGLGGVMGALPMIMYRINPKDTISPKSLSGAGIMYTSNNSWAGIIFNKFYFNEDKYRLILGGGKGIFSSQFFSEELNSYFDFSSDDLFLKIELHRIIFKDFYAGINYQYIDTSTNIDKEGAEVIDKTFNILGLVLTYDKRDYVYYPTSGFLSDLKWNTAPEFVGNQSSLSKLEISYNRYWQISNNRDVFAARAFTGIGFGNLNIVEQFVIRGKDIRGYTNGRYRGEQVVSLQGEYRFNPWKRIGFVGFSGFASVFNGDNPSDNGVILPSLGAGIRYAAFPKNKLNVGLEAAVGRGDWGIYFRVGETF